MKIESAKLKNKEPESYEALLVSLSEFADKHGAEIGVLLKYVKLLEKRHAMVPGYCLPIVCGALRGWQIGK